MFPVYRARSCGQMRPDRAPARKAAPAARPRAWSYDCRIMGQISQGRRWRDRKDSMRGTMAARSPPGRPCSAPSIGSSSTATPAACGSVTGPGLAFPDQPSFTFSSPITWPRLLSRPCRDAPGPDPWPHLSICALPCFGSHYRQWFSRNGAAPPTPGHTSFG